MAAAKIWRIAEVYTLKKTLYRLYNFENSARE